MKNSRSVHEVFKFLYFNQFHQYQKLQRFNEHMRRSTFLGISFESLNTVN